MAVAGKVNETIHALGWMACGGALAQAFLSLLMGGELQGAFGWLISAVVVGIMTVAIRPG